MSTTTTHEDVWEQAHDKACAHPVLTATQEKFLARRYLRGEHWAKEELIRCNYRLVVSIAKRHATQTMPFREAVQIGHIGLIRAAELFDWRKGFKFSTYATWWIKQAITRESYRNNSAIRVPTHIGIVMSKCRKAASAYEVQFGRAPSVEEIAATVEETEADVRTALEMRSRKIVSLNEHVGEGEETEREAFVAVADDNTEDEAAARVERELLDAALGELDKGAREVVEARYLRGESLLEIARRTGYSQAEVRKVERAAIARLRGEGK